MKPVIEEGEKFLQLDTNSPEFKLKFILIKDKLVNFRSEDMKEMEYATELIKKINNKYRGAVGVDVSKALQTFLSDIKYGKATEMFLLRIAIPELVGARSVCEQFRAFANTTISKGMHKNSNKYALKYAVTLAQQVQKLYSEKADSFWSSYEEYKSFLVQAVNRGTLDISTIPALAKVIELVEKEIIDKEYGEDVQELHVFSKANDVKDKIKLKEKLSRMTHLSITDVEGLNNYYDEVIKEIGQSLAEGTITDLEYDEYNRKLMSEYKCLLRPDTGNVLTPILIFNDVLNGNGNKSKMLQFTEQEMLESFTFACKFVKFFANENIEDMALNCRKLNVSNVKLMIGQNADYLDRGSKTFTDLLLTFGIITPDKYERDLAILQEG